MVGDMSRVILNFDLSIPFVHFRPGSRPVLTPKIKRVHTFTGSHLRAVTVTDDDDDDADNVRQTPQYNHYRVTINKQWQNIGLQTYIPVANMLGELN